MLNSFKKAFNRFCNYFLEEEPEKNLYCIPCKWEVTGNVYISAPSIEAAKVYVKSHPIPPELEECVCYRMIADTEHPILCTCGNCGEDYVISEIHNMKVCPKCGNGGDLLEQN